MKDGGHTNGRTMINDYPCRVMSDREAAVLVEAGRIVGYRADGLGCRVIALLNTLRLSRLLGLEAEFLWEMGSAGDAHLHGYSNGHATAFLEEIVIDVRTAAREGVPTRVNMQANKPLRLKDEAPAQVYEDLRAIARGLRLPDGSQLGEAIKPDRFAACLHVRAGDTRQIRWLLTKYFPETGWQRVLERVLAADESGEVFVASDSAAFLDEAKRRHGARVVTAADIAPPPPDKLAADLRDVMLLSQGRTIVAPRMSNFSLLAALVGGVPRQRPEDVLEVTDVVEDVTATAVEAYVADVSALIAYVDAAAVDAEGPDIASIRRTLAALESRVMGTTRHADVTSRRHR